jgi:hypothetical protein
MAVKRISGLSYPVSSSQQQVAWGSHDPNSGNSNPQWIQSPVLSGSA